MDGRNARLNGRPVRGAATARDGDLLTVPGVGRLVVDEGDTGLLSGARWEDGRLVRFATPGFAMARALAWRIDEGVQRNGGAEGRDVTLSLNLGLSARLGARLDAFAAARPAIQSMAVTVMDARTGEVVALAGWSRSVPVRVGPLCPDSSALDEAGEESATALRLNFTPHFPGSTVKPLMAAAAFSRYPVLRTLQVTHPGVPKAPQIAGLPATRPGWDGLDIATEARCVSDGSNGTRVITPQLFLTCSSNLYEATLTFLASARPAPDSTRPGLGGEGRWAYAAQLDGQPLRRRPALEGLGGCTAGACRITPGHLQPSPLAGELSRLFDVSTSQRQAERGDGGYDTALWAALDSAGMLTPSRHRRNQVSACAAEPLFDQVRSTDELARFAIGAQDNRWTNVKLAEAFARVVTGRRVRATLVREVGGARVTAAAPPLGGDSLWRAPITAGLLRAADVGTARALRPFPAEVRQALRARGDSTGMEFNLAAKTGTLNDAGAHLKVLVAAAGFWTRGRTAAELACGVTLALHVVYSPTGARLPSEQLQLAAQEVLPALRDHFGWDDPARARRCSTTR